MVIMIALATHWLFDFLLQNDKMALNKSKSYRWLLIHSIIYACGMCFFLGMANIIPFTIFSLNVLLISHFIIDGITSRINAKLWGMGERHWFFVMIGLDQLLHYAVLLYLLK